MGTNHAGILPRFKDAEKKKQILPWAFPTSLHIAIFLPSRGNTNINAVAMFFAAGDNTSCCVEQPRCQDMDG